MYTRLINLFAINGYSLFVICMLLVGIGVSITLPYLSLYFTEDVGLSSGAFGVFIAVTINRYINFGGFWIQRTFLWGIYDFSYNCISCISVSGKTKIGSNKYRIETKYKFLFAQKQTD